MAAAACLVVVAAVSIGAAFVNGIIDDSSDDKRITANSEAISGNDVQLNEWNRVILGDYMLLCNSKDDPDKGIAYGIPVVFDFNTMDTTILCNRPNCSHSDSNCIAYTLNENSQLPIFWKNCLYYFTESSGSVERDGKRVLDLKASLIKYSMDDMTRSTVATIDGYNISSSTGAGSCLIGTEYYFITTNGDPRYDEAGNVVGLGNGGQAKLFSVDLESKKVTDYGEIFDYEKYKNQSNIIHSWLIGVDGNNIYFRVDFGSSTTNKPQVFAFNTVSKSFSKYDDVFGKQVRDGYMLYYSSNGRTDTINDRDKNAEKKILVRDLATGEIIKGPVFDNNISLGSGKVWYDNCCFDIKTGKIAEIPGASKHSSVWYHTLYKDNYILDVYGDNGKQTVKIAQDEIDNQFE